MYVFTTWEDTNVKHTYKRLIRNGSLLLLLITVCMLNACEKTEAIAKADETVMEKMTTEEVISSEKAAEPSTESTSIPEEEATTVTETTEPATENTETTESDTEAPVISGVKEITAYLGDNISYKKGVSVTDNIDEEVQLTIDKSAVNTNAIGDYPIIYSAVDSAGNTASETTVLHIIEKPIIDENTVAPLADALIARLTTPEMSNWDKAYVLWEWCRTNIMYSYSAGDRSSIWAGAYEGLHDQAGDCYTYYATYEVLLRRLGIETIQVSRVGGTSNHWWNLVNLGNGWYHCDNTNKDFWFNTPEVIEAKTEYAINNGFGGVMIWHYNCDLPSTHEDSLLRAVDRAIKTCE